MKIETPDPPVTYLVWLHRNGRVYRRRLWSDTFSVPKNCQCFNIEVVDGTTRAIGRSRRVLAS